MAKRVQCPNPSCRRESYLGDDPLGRVFRCPRCLTKFPMAANTAPDSGWMAVLGPLPRKFAVSAVAKGQFDRPFQRASSPTDASSLRASSKRQIPRQLVIESGEFCIAGFHLASDDSWVSDPTTDQGSQESTVARADSLRRDELSGQSQFWLTEMHAVCAQTVLRASDEVWGRLQHDPFPATNEPQQLSRFRILSVLGEGRQAIVYRAFDPLLQRQVALKLPLEGTIPTPRTFERFLEEARALARLAHPRIVPVYEAGCAANCHYIAMALIEGSSLAEQIAGRRISIVRAAEIAADLADALAYAHQRGIVHRDVKPANVRVDTQGDVYLMDFGMAHRPHSAESSRSTGAIIGTPSYLAPEQARGEERDVSPRSDQYSLGAVLYEMLCGKPPFLGAPSLVLFNAIHKDPAPLRELEPRIPRRLAAICRKAMSKRLKDRYLDCQDLADDLRRWLRGRTTPLNCRSAWRKWLP